MSHRYHWVAIEAVETSTDLLTTPYRGVNEDWHHHYYVPHFHWSHSGKEGVYHVALGLFNRVALSMISHWYTGLLSPIVVLKVNHPPLCL